MNINTGIYLLNEQESRLNSSAFCVLGMPRGGTTMCAKLLQEAGVYMGSNLPITAEDPDFAQLLRRDNPNHQEFLNLVELRKATYQKWGFKAPFRNHWNLLANIDNIKYLVIFRDVLAVANRNKISAGTDIITSIGANLTLLKNILDFITTTTSPALLISYEKALIDPYRTSAAILDFTGTSTNETTLKKMQNIIQPNEISYITNQDPTVSNIQICIDVITSHRIAGWARSHKHGLLSLKIEIDGTEYGSTTASLPRKDLAKLFRDEGRYGFDMALPNIDINKGSLLLIKCAKNETILLKKLIEGTKFPNQNN